MRSNNPKKFFTQSEKDVVVKSIKKAEKNTSGEIRVHLEKKVKGDIYARAVKIFNKLKMYKTAARNGCLILLDITNKQFAVIGDKGINEKVEEGFWDDSIEIMKKYFKEDDFAEGLSKGIERIGENLKKYFPYQDDDINELSDEISMG